MQHITGISRQQLQISSLEDKIALDNPVRFIEAFVEHISLQALGFTAKTIKTEGRPSFDTKVFLKIYLYGYLNGLRSSRKLEKECVRNIELQWLLCDIVPNYHSISDFRKQNPSGLTAGSEIDFAIVSGTIGRNPKERERISFGLELTKVTLMLLVALAKAVGRLHRVRF